MKQVFNPTGTHVKQNIKTGDKLLKVRIDFIPEETEKTYELHHVWMPIEPLPEYPGKVDEFGNPVDQDDFNKWYESLPHEWRTNSCISCFFTVPETINEQDFLLELDNRFKPDDIATLDNTMVLPDSLHYINPFVKDRLKTTTQKVLTSDIEDLIASINTKFEKIDVLKVSGEPFEIEPQSIDVGSAAIDRAITTSLQTTVNGNNAANASGTLESVEVWLASADSVGHQVGSVTMSGSNATTRDYEAVGILSAGSKQTASGLDIDIESGDYLGMDGSDATLERDTSGGAYQWHHYTDNYLDNLSNTAMNEWAGRILSLYGTGTESGGAAWTPKTAFIM